MDYKKEFEKIARANIKREGIESILSLMSQTDFYEAPASTRFHDSELHGLVKHSLNVYHQLVRDLKCAVENGEIESEKYSMETITLVSLFHDICKIGFYTTEMRNTKENGKWIKVPYYTVNDLFPIGHGEKSVIMLMEHMKLDTEEILAIRWHMGLSVPKEMYSSISLAFNESPLALYLHLADMKATYLIK